MPKIIPTIILLFLGFIPATSHAQESSIPWPPDPAEIFEERVEVVDTEFITYLVEPFADNQRRVVHVYDEQTEVWRDFYYPNAVKQFVSDEDAIIRRQDGKYLFREGLYGQNYPWPWWLLNPNNGKFTLAATICNGEPLMLPGDGEWVISPAKVNASMYYLCFTETGELTKPLPDIEGWGWGVYETRMSPKRDWVLLYPGDCASEIYGYEISTGKLITVGTYESSDDCWLVSWVDDYHFVLRKEGTPEWSSRSVLVGDIRQADSLLSIGGYRWRPDYYDNPPRYEYMDGLAENTGPYYCELEIISLETFQYSSYDLGEICWPNILLPNGNRLFLEEGTNDAADVLFSLDLESNQRIDLFEGQIGYVDKNNLSPDGHYLVMALLDTTKSVQSDFEQFAIFDLIERKIVYVLDENTDLLYGWPYDLTEILYDVHWFRNDAFLLRLDNYNHTSSAIFFIWLDEMQTIAVNNLRNTVYFDEALSPDFDRALVWRHEQGDDCDVTALSVFDIHTQKFFAVTGFFDQDIYQGQTVWTTDEIATLTLRPGRDLRESFNSFNFSPALVRYTIRIPG